jgi:hypothetical protein
MRFQIISDVHTEFHRDGGKYFCENVPVLSSVLVIAGDFSMHKHMVVNISTLANRFENVIYVHGNHEYYGTPRGEIHNTMNKLMNRFPNFHWLNNKAIEVEGQRFVGATMWFKDTVDNIFYQNLMNDFSSIPAFRKWVYEENKKTLDFFRKEIKAGDVVITHHAPCELSSDPRYKGSPTNRFYVCDQSELIRERKPSYWIHGHMHTPVEYSLYDTWVVSNPFGYIGHEWTPAVELYYKVLGD